MLFNSVEFLIFFPIVFILTLLLRGRLRWIVLLAASYIFYMSWQPEYILLLLVSTFSAYAAAYGMSQTSDNRKRAFYLAAGLLVNFGLLIYFKYYTHTQLLLPVGISYYTFQTVGYTLDVYRSNIQPEKNPGVFALFVAFFPHLASGPIARARDLIPQLREFAYQRLLDAPAIADGLRLITWGLFKKIVVADRLALYVNPIYNNPENYQGLSLILATVFFAFQIYCDFSGYTDMALGVARLFGIKLMQNFRQPYFAMSIRDFWQRWHISLSTWFRDYLFMPLSRNLLRRTNGKHSRWIQALCNFIVMLLVGIWHGPSWTFLMWGALHGFYMSVESALNLRVKMTPATPIEMVIRWGRTALTFVLVCLGWIFFRAASFDDALTIISNMFVLNGDWSSVSDHMNILIGLMGIVTVIAVDSVMEWVPVNLLRDQRLVVARFVLYTLLVFSLTLFALFGASQEFVYFQF